jgi:hypothetical protein
MTTKTLPVIAFLLVSLNGYAQQTPTPAAAEWWRLTTALSNDQMEGRDTGTEAYERAAKYVADQFKAAGLKPAGDDGTYFQRVPMHQIDLDVAHSSVTVAGASGSHSLALLEDISIGARENLPAETTGELVFTGYGTVDPAIDLHGKVAVYFNNAPASLSAADKQTFNANRVRGLLQAGAIATISILDPVALEPPHWPVAYSRSVTIKGSERLAREAPLAFTFNADSFQKLFGKPNQHVTAAHPLAEFLHHAEAGDPLPSFALDSTIDIKLATTSKDISSPNIIAILPGSDPTLSAEYVAVSAHLDGYGYGSPVLGDKLYNGALDDAAYVATLIEMAQKLTTPPRQIPKRSLLFCIFTGEEKGLLGSVWYTQHLTVPKEGIVADLNLDQLRPIFPLKILTMEGIDDSTIGETARGVAATFGIELRPDHETERRLFSRSDNYSFVRIGVPIGSFIFGYNPNTEEERIYRDWYARRYHKPQDDLNTPINWPAAVTFNNFYRALALALANAPSRPHWLPASQYAPKP